LRNEVAWSCNVASPVSAALGRLWGFGLSPALLRVHWIARAVRPARRAIAATGTPALNAAITSSSDGARVRCAGTRWPSFGPSSRRWPGANMVRGVIPASRKDMHEMIGLLISYINRTYPIAFVGPEISCGTIGKIL
jgi:hypothetical protein